MPNSLPPPISAQQERARLGRIRRLAKKLGFQGKVEYRHAWSGTGGAQYGMGAAADEDVLLVFAEAFQRDADKEDFSLAALLAHERGHQLLVRNTKLLPVRAKEISLASEEILASLLGSLIAEEEKDRQNLFYKALAESLAQGMEADHAVRLLHDLRSLLEQKL